MQFIRASWSVTIIMATFFFFLQLTHLWQMLQRVHFGLCMRKSHTPTAETKADHSFLMFFYLPVFSALLSLMISPSAWGENAVRVESFGKSVDTHLFTNTKLPCWNALHPKWQTVGGCLFFSLPVTDSYTHTACQYQWKVCSTETWHYSII